MGRSADVDQLVGSAEIADRLAVSNSQVIHVWRGRQPGETAELQHKLEHLAWKLAYHADTFGVTAGEAAA